MRLLAITTLALLAAGCGSSGPGSNSGQAQSDAAAAFQYARCMRDHGVPNYPDPKVSSGNGHVAVQAVAPGGPSPEFNAAVKACQGILNALAAGPSHAQQEARKQALLAFARCLRGHGISNFPDPNSQGQLSLQTVNAAGVDIHARSFGSAARACVAVTHGAITLADVARAVNGSH
jgi:hypothetical protein